MTTLSAKGDVDGSTPSHTQGMFKTGVGKMWQAFVDLFGTDSGAMRTVHETAKLNGPGILQNLKLTPTVGSNALTMTVQTRAGAVPSAADPVLVSVRNATATAGDSLLRQVSATLALTISSGSTLGHSSGAAGTIYWYLVDSDGAGTMKLAASSTYYGPSFIGTTVAEGGAGAADSATVIYSDAIYSNKAMRLVGKTIDTQTTAGTWTAVPSQVDLWPFDAPVSSTVPQIQPITATIGANAMTLGYSGGTLDFRSATAGSGTVTSLTVGSLNTVISSGSTGGTISGVASRIWVAVINNAGTPELAWMCAYLGNGQIASIDESQLISTTAEGGAGAADSAGVWYSTTARSNVAFRVVGFVESTQATAGTWATSPSRIQGMGPGVRLPGSIVKVTRTLLDTVATGATAIPQDDTIPQNTEGALFLSGSVTPTNACNLLFTRWQFVGSPNGNNQMIATLTKDSQANVVSSMILTSGTTLLAILPSTFAEIANSTSPTTYGMRAGTSVGNTVTAIGVSGGRYFGGTLVCEITTEERSV